MKNTTRSLFSLRLMNLRKQRNLTQEDMSQTLHLSRSTYTCYETGTSAPGLTTLSEIADIFGVSVDYLLGHGEQQTPLVPLRDGGISTDEQTLLEQYRQLDPKEQEAFLNLIVAINK